MATNSSQVEIWTDGACKGNPGVGGWGALLRQGRHEKTLYGGELDTTNNRMELMAVIQALKALKRSCDVVVHTDSQYRSEEHTSELQSLMRISYAVFCLKKKTTYHRTYKKNPPMINNTLIIQY